MCFAVIMSSLYLSNKDGRIKNPHKYFIFFYSFREDEDEEFRAFPIVKESGDQLIETGINTLQKTLLLKKEVEIEQVQYELACKRQEFKERMDMCTQHQIEVQKKQQQVRHA